MLIGNLAINMMKLKMRLSFGLKPRVWGQGSNYLHYLEGGERGTRPTLVFLHGLGAGKDQWGKEFYSFAKHFHCIFLDLPGEGESFFDWQENYSPANQAKKLHSFFQINSLSNVILVGSSVGGCVAAIYAAHHPDNVAALVVMAPAGLKAPAPSQVMDNFIKQGKHPFGYRSVDEMERFWQLVFHRPPQIPRVVAKALAQKGASRFERIDKIVIDLTNSGLFPLESLPNSLPIETLVIWGEKDRVFDVSSTQRVKELWPKAQIRVFDDVGHVPYLEAGAKTVREINLFLQSLAMEAKPEHI